MKNKNIKVLFICKDRNNPYGISFGLINSCLFICNALRKFGIDCKVAQVRDNNCIDREVHLYKPTHVFIEALWVVPSKFEVLLPKYRNVEWFVRVHSKIPFISNEGIAIEWFKGYSDLMNKYSNFHIAANSAEIVEDMIRSFNIKVYYFPNIYCPPQYNCEHIPQPSTNHIDVGCFGAIRPMKNQLYQALAAITFGNEIGKTIRFHINSNRIEQKGDPILKNIIHAFEHTHHHLICHKWMNHEEFIKLVRRMEIGMQVSFSETFNIVAGDFVWNDIPVVGSPEISWLNFLYRANPNSLDSMVTKLYIAYFGRYVNLQRLNKICLDRYNCKSVSIWLDFLKVI